MYPINYDYFYPYPASSYSPEYLDPRLGGSPGGVGSKPVSFPPHLIQKYHMLKNNPTAIQQELHKPKQYAAGCEGQPTIIMTDNPFTGVPNVFLMLVVSSDPSGFTTGILYPTGSFGRFPTSKIILYSCV